MNTKVRLKMGNAIVFCGQEEHKGIDIENGTRYILTGFLNIFNPKFCEKYQNETKHKTKKNK